MPGSPVDEPEGHAVTDPVPALTVAAVARRLGVAPATLRTWDRRYGLGPGVHAAGSHRRYTPADVARLEVMGRLTRQGVSPAEAARVARSTPESERAASESLAPAADLPAADLPDAKSLARLEDWRVGGGRVMRLAAGGPATRGLARAAMALDAPTVCEIVESTLERRGVLATWDELLVPVLVSVGTRWEATGQGVEVEHLLAECIISSLRPVIARVQHPLNVRPVLLASAEDELHSLPLHALAAGLAERQVSTRIFGARVPRDALAAAVRRSGPAAVFIWSHSPQTGAGDALADLATVRPSPVLLVGGPGWRADLPAAVRRVEDLTEAVEAVTRAVGL
jgi:DNA-binding transcriptional MerR regulator